LIFLFGIPIGVFVVSLFEDEPPISCLSYSFFIGVSEVVEFNSSFYVLAFGVVASVAWVWDPICLPFYVVW
jgi:hypothetical protein